MATDKDKFIQLVSKLIELTQDGKLQWKHVSPRPSLSNDPDAAVEILYKTKFMDKYLALYKIKVKSIGVSTSSWASGSASIADNIFGTPTSFYEEKIRLEITDYDGNCLWQIPSVRGLSDLYEAVQYQVADVKNFLDSALNYKKENNDEL